MLRLIALVLALQTAAVAAADQWLQVDTSRGDTVLAEYFLHQTQQIADATFADIHSLADWRAKRGEARRQLFEMLGLDPLPEKTPLQAVVTGRVEHEDFAVEKLHFQSRPGLYVTGNLYLPRQRTEPAPTVLYVCGHAPAKKNGVSFGNKTAYQHHGAWFARHGYVCLTIDTLQLGEIEGLHHGTYEEGMYWWISRGYTPAGVEAWNCIRALDYLETRAEVDTERIGVTGRSGGGAYSWWVAALDDRIRVAVPVAGITSLKNHVVDGCIENHCDCMYMINTYRWDFPLVAALVAPRPLLISNTDKDRIFPLDGVYDVYGKTRRIYDLFAASEKLGLHVCEGPHRDTQQLRVHAFQWMNRWLKDEEPLIEQAANKLFQPEQLRVFETLPEDQINTTVHESFVVAADTPPLPESRAEWDQLRNTWMTALRERVFRGWPQAGELPPLELTEVLSMEHGDYRLRIFTFTSQRPYRLPLYVVTRRQPCEQDDGSARFVCCDQQQWEQNLRGLLAGFPKLQVSGGVGEADRSSWTRITNELIGTPQLGACRRSSAWVGLAPRGIGPTEWTRDERKRTHIRRRFVLLGQTLAGMRVWDVRRGLQATRQALGMREQQPIRLSAAREAAVWSLYASLFEPVERLRLRQPPATHREGPALLNISRFSDLAQTVTMAVDRGPLWAGFSGRTLPWEYASQTKSRLEGQGEATDWRLQLESLRR